MKSTKEFQTLGQTVRAGRMGYHYSQKHGGYVRLSHQGESIRVDLRPPGLIGARDSLDKEYIVWWEIKKGQKDEPDILDMIAPLKPITQIKEQITFYVDQEGQFIPEKLGHFSIGSNSA